MCCDLARMILLVDVSPYYHLCHSTLTRNNSIITHRQRWPAQPCRWPGPAASDLFNWPFLFVRNAFFDRLQILWCINYRFHPALYRASAQSAKDIFSCSSHEALQTSTSLSGQPITIVKSAGGAGPSLPRGDSELQLTRTVLPSEKLNLGYRWPTVWPCLAHLWTHISSSPLDLQNLYLENVEKGQINYSRG